MLQPLARVVVIGSAQDVGQNDMGGDDGVARPAAVLSRSGARLRKGGEEGVGSSNLDGSSAAEAGADNGEKSFPLPLGVASSLGKADK